MKKKKSSAGFGGDWTTRKLEVVGEYLSAYTTALKNKPFKTAYIDAFAGTGYRELKDEERPDQLSLPDIAEDAPQRFLDGSAAMALRTNPRFNKYIFVERRPDRCKELEDLKKDFPVLACDIDVRNADANQYLQDLGRRRWTSHRAVLFLDPYGMQVDWSSIAAVASTKSIDMWVLFPLGIAVNRLLRRDAEISQPWRRRLDRIFGTKKWFEAFYEKRTTRNILGEDVEQWVKTATPKVIGKFFNDLLESVFSMVAPNPRVLANSRGCPLYLLCFAAGNPAGAPVAVKIAKYLLEKV